MSDFFGGGVDCQDAVDNFGGMDSRLLGNDGLEVVFDVQGVEGAVEALGLDFDGYGTFFDVEGGRGGEWGGQVWARRSASWMKSAVSWMRRSITMGGQ